MLKRFIPKCISYVLVATLAFGGVTATQSLSLFDTVLADDEVTESEDHSGETTAAAEIAEANAPESTEVVSDPVADPATEIETGDVINENQSTGAGDAAVDVATGATVITNATDATIDVNSGAVVVNNGAIAENAAGTTSGEIVIPSGDVFVNNGTITDNNGHVHLNDYTPAEAGSEAPATGGVIENNAGILDQNNWLVTTNTGEININTKTGAIANNGKATPASDDDKGKVTTNRGTIINNNSGSKVTSNSGTITSNAGNVDDNASKGVITTNSGTVGKADDDTTGNKGNIKTNTGVVTVNSGTIGGTETSDRGNEGTVTSNSGVITKNSGLVENNSGEIASNTGEATVTTTDGVTTFDEDGGIVDNGGTVTENSGTIKKNNTSGTVEENKDGGQILTNLGLVEANDEGAKVYHNGQDAESIPTGAPGSAYTGEIDTNDGDVVVNEKTGVITDNNGNVDTNNGTITDNNADAVVKDNNGIVETNKASAVIEINDGVINVNDGTVGNGTEEGKKNNGTVKFNDGTVVSSSEGAVKVNFGGTVTGGNVEINLGEGNVTGTSPIKQMWEVMSNFWDVITRNKTDEAEGDVYALDTSKKAEATDESAASDIKLFLLEDEGAMIIKPVDDSVEFSGLIIVDENGEPISEDSLAEYAKISAVDGGWRISDIKKDIHIKPVEKSADPDPSPTPSPTPAPKKRTNSEEKKEEGGDGGDNNSSSNPVPVTPVTTPAITPPAATANLAQSLTAEVPITGISAIQVDSNGTVTSVAITPVLDKNVPVAQFAFAAQAAQNAFGVTPDQLQIISSMNVSSIQAGTVTFNIKGLKLTKESRVIAIITDTLTGQTTYSPISLNSNGTVSIKMPSQHCVVSIVRIK